MTLIEILLLIIAVTGIFAILELRKLNKDMSFSTQVFFSASDHRWDNTADQRQALLDIASALDNVEHQLERIESNTGTE